MEIELATSYRTMKQCHSGNNKRTYSIHVPKKISCEYSYCIPVN